MVRSKEGGGSGQKQERGEGEEKSEGGGTYWWAVGPESSTLVVIRDGGCWRHLVVAVRGGGHWHRLHIVICFCSPLPLFATVPRALLSIVLSYPSRVAELFGIG